MKTPGPAIAALLALATPGAAARADIPESEVATWPPEHQEAFELMTRRCTRCHSVEHALAPKLPVAAWSAALRKMARLGTGLTGVQMAEVAQLRAFYVARRPAP